MVEKRDVSEKGNTRPGGANLLQSAAAAATGATGEVGSKVQRLLCRQPIRDVSQVRTDPLHTQTINSTSSPTSSGRD